MRECPICHETFGPDQAVTYLDEDYCSVACAEIAAQEGRNTSEQLEPETAAAD